MIAAIARGYAACENGNGRCTQEGRQTMTSHQPADGPVTSAVGKAQGAAGTPSSPDQIHGVYRARPPGLAKPGAVGGARNGISVNLRANGRLHLQALTGASHLLAALDGRGRR